MSGSARRLLWRRKQRRTEWRGGRGAVKGQARVRNVAARGWRCGFVVLSFPTIDVCLRFLLVFTCGRKNALNDAVLWLVL